MAKRGNANTTTSKGLPALRVPNLVSEVVGELRKRILSGAFPANENLPPTEELSNSFGVSRTVIREALRHLQAQDLVEVERGRRPRVKPVDPKAAVDSIKALFERAHGTPDDLLEVRQALETQVASLAAKRATPEQIDAMIAANEAMRVAKTIQTRIEHDWQFHESLAEASNNPLFVLLAKTIAGVLHESMRKTAHSKTDVVYQSHKRLIDAITERDESKAGKVALENLQLTREDLKGRRS